MNQVFLLVMTALVEVGAGLVLLCLPAVALDLLLGIREPVPETLFVGRVTGAALLALGTICWLARSDQRSTSQQGVLLGVLIYDVAAAALLAYAALGLSLAGIVLWPAVALHTVLAGWCVVCLYR